MPSSGLAFPGTLSSDISPARCRAWRRGQSGEEGPGVKKAELEWIVWGPNPGLGNDGAERRRGYE